MNWPALTFFSTAILAIAGFINAFILQSIKLEIMRLESRLKDWAHAQFASSERVTALEERLSSLERR